MSEERNLDLAHDFTAASHEARRREERERERERERETLNIFQNSPAEFYKLTSLFSDGLSLSPGIFPVVRASPFKKARFNP